MEVPEIQEGTVVIKSLVREPGHRTKIAVESTDPRVDPVGACVGVRGSRIRSIVDELHGEHIDIVPFSTDVREFIMNSLQQVRVVEIDINEEENKVTLLVDKEDLSRAIGRRGQNIRLTSRLVGMEVDVSAAEEEPGEGGEAQPDADEGSSGAQEEDTSVPEEQTETAVAEEGPGSDGAETPTGPADDAAGTSAGASIEEEDASPSPDAGEDETSGEQGAG